MLENMPTPETPWNRRWAIVLRPDLETKDEEQEQMPTIIGTIGIVREGEIGYKLNPNFWGKGYMTEALAMFSKMFFEDEGKNSMSFYVLFFQLICLDSVKGNSKYDRLIAYADPENFGSTKVLLKSGFQKGIYRSAYYQRRYMLERGNEKMSDLQQFILLRPSLGTVP
jgi:ribosomal-protein-alanine N-acetyltransferase